MDKQKFDEGSFGIYVIAATPFTETGAVDMGSVDTLADFYLDEGVHGMTVLGVMGEAQKLTDSEQIALLNRYIERINGRVPVVVGVSNPGIDNVISLSKKMGRTLPFHHRIQLKLLLGSTYALCIANNKLKWVLLCPKERLKRPFKAIIV